MKCKRIIGIDPGETCGMVVLDDGQITAVFNIMSEKLWNKVTTFLIHGDCTVVVEDIKPYSGRLTPQIIDTCKWIGMAVYRLRNEAGANVELVSRNEIKKWVFDTFQDVAIPIVDKRMNKKIFMACNAKTKEIVFVDNNGKPKRKASFVFVNDKCVTESMKKLYGIPTNDAGKGYKYGLKDHAWQALACASFKHWKQTLT